MTLPFNPLRAAELARQAMEDDERVTAAPWTSTDGCAVFADGMNLIADTFSACGDSDEAIPMPWSQPQCATNAAGIARSRNALREMAEQLMAAVQEVERLRATPDVLRPLTEAQIKRALHEGRAESMAATGDNAWSTLLADRDSLRASCEQLTRERDDLRANVRHVQATLQAVRLDHISTLGQAAELEAELAKMRPVYETSIALRRSESRAALASDIIAEIEAERALTDAQVEARTHAALTRWRSAIDSALSSTHQAGTK